MTHRIPFVIGTFSLAAMLVTGCGPTKEGIKQRELARDRVDFINTQFAYEQAKQAFEIGQLDRSLNEIEAVIARYDEVADYRVLHGRILIEQGRLEDAMRSFDRALAISDASHEANYYSAIIYQRWSDYETAYERYHAASEIDGENVQYLLAAAESLIACDRLDEAQTLLEGRLDHFEHNAAMQHLLAQVATIDGDYEAAVDHFRRARMLRSDDVVLLEGLVHAQYRAEMFGPCLDSVMELELVLDEDRSDLGLIKARCLSRLGRTIQARDVYIALTTERSTDIDVWIELGMLAWELGDFRRVAEASTHVMKLDETRYQGYLLRGVNERHRGRLDNAIAMFTEAASRGEVAAPWVMLGLALNENGDVVGAREAYERALLVDPDHVHARALLQHLQTGATAGVGS